MPARIACGRFRQPEIVIHFTPLRTSDMCDMLLRSGF
jgi:hypothetical protein